MWNPLEVTTDPADNVFVSGGNDRVVQIIDAATRYWGTVAGNSKRAVDGGFSGDGGPAQSARLANVRIDAAAGIRQSGPISQTGECRQQRRCGGQSLYRGPGQQPP